MKEAEKKGKYENKIARKVKGRLLLVRTCWTDGQSANITHRVCRREKTASVTMVNWSSFQSKEISLARSIYDRITKINSQLITSACGVVPWYGHVVAAMGRNFYWSQFLNLHRVLN